MPLPFDFEGKGESLELVAEAASSSLNQLLCTKWKDKKGHYFLGFEPNSVLDTIASPSPPTSTSTLSSSLCGGGGGGAGGGGGSTDTAAVAAVSGNSSQQWQETSSSKVGAELGSGSTAAAAAATAEKCGLGTEDWESMLSDSVTASPGQEQSVLRWIMGDVDDPSVGLNKLLQSGGGPPPADFEFSGGFGVVDQGFGLDPAGNLMGPINPSLSNSGFPNYKVPIHSNPILPQFSSNFVPFSPQESSDSKSQILNPQLLINQHQSHQTQNPAFFLPLPYTHQEQHLILPPQAKRHNPGGGGGGGGGGIEPMVHDLSNHPQFLPHYLHQRPPKMISDEMMGYQQQQAVIDQLYKAAELVEMGNPVLAQGILARLNHHLSPIGKPFLRAAFFCKEALQLLLQTNNNNMTQNSAATSSPFDLIMRIGAYKLFSEISPLLQFANFTCNQALLEVLEGYDQIHVIDFDIGYGGQWASLMQELALRGGGSPSLKITAFASPSTHDKLELDLTRENLIHFAGEISIPFEFEILSLDSLHSASWSLPLHLSENEAVAVNLPIGSISNYQLSLPLILRFVKQLSPKIVVSVDRGCDRTDLPFPNHVIHALQSYSNLLESLDAVNVNLDALQKIERFLLQPGIEKIVMGRYHSPEKTPHWRNLFLSSGFSPLTFSNLAESQADCVVKRTPVRGFHVEKRQSSLVLCWQRKELISASAWRC